MKINPFTASIRFAASNKSSPCFYPRGRNINCLGTSIRLSNCFLPHSFSISRPFSSVYHFVRLSALCQTFRPPHVFKKQPSIIHAPRQPFPTKHIYAMFSIAHHVTLLSVPIALGRSIPSAPSINSAIKREPNDLFPRWDTGHHTVPPTMRRVIPQVILTITISLPFENLMISRKTPCHQFTQLEFVTYPISSFGTIEWILEAIREYIYRKTIKITSVSVLLAPFGKLTFWHKRTSLQEFPSPPSWSC